MAEKKKHFALATPNAALVSLDIETSGLDPKKDEILEVAAVAIDPFTLKELCEPFNMVVRPRDFAALMAKADPWILTQHGGSGLLAEARNAAHNIQEVLELLKNWLRDMRRGADKASAMLMSNSPQGVDIPFLSFNGFEYQVFMSHRVLDMTSVAMGLDLIGLPVHDGCRTTGGNHRALGDAKWCINQLRHLRQYAETSVSPAMAKFFGEEAVQTALEFRSLVEEREGKEEEVVKDDDADNADTED